MWPFILSGVATNVINAAVHAIMIFGAGLGVPSVVACMSKSKLFDSHYCVHQYSGAALSMVVSNYCQPIILIVYVWARKLHKQPWDGEI